MTQATWETILFVNSILVAIAMVVLVFATGASLILLDWHWFAYALGVFFFLLCTEAIAGAYTD